MAKKLLYSKSFIIFLIIIFVLVIVALGRESYRYFKINQEIRDLEKRIEALEISNEELSQMQDYFQSEEFLEKEARLKLNLTKPGESLIIVKKTEGLGGGEQETIIAKEISNIQKWWEYFFGHE